MSTKTKALKAAETPAEQTITSYKGFDADWKCRNFQYAVGSTFEHAGEVSACNSGFHACEHPLHVLRYYKPNTSRFAVVEQSGTLARHGEDSKVASSRITIKAEIDIAGLVKAAIKYTLDRCTPALGGTSDEANTAVSASGPNKAATASGDYGAATASGNSGAATASGDSGAATASGRNSKARGKIGCALFLVYRGAYQRIVHAKALIVGLDGIKADVFYTLDKSGNAVEVA